MRLNELKDNPGSARTRKRVGRGIGSGKGKTAGRGVKGQKARSGVAINGFEGGQMPIHMRLPKRGFNNPLRKSYAETNLGKLQEAVEAGKLDAGAPVTAEAMMAAGLIRRKRDGVRVLGQGNLRAALRLEVAGISESARKAVEEAGGSVIILKKTEAEDAPQKRGKGKGAGKTSSARGNTADKEQ